MYPISIKETNVIFALKHVMTVGYLIFLRDSCILEKRKSPVTDDLNRSVRYAKCSHVCMTPKVGDICKFDKLTRQLQLESIYVE